MTLASTNTETGSRLLLHSRQARGPSRQLQVTSRMVQFCGLHASHVHVAVTVTALSSGWLLCWLGRPPAVEQAGSQAAANRHHCRC